MGLKKFTLIDALNEVADREGIHVAAITEIFFDNTNCLKVYYRVYKQKMKSHILRKA